MPSPLSLDRDRAGAIRLLALDVDGVLTDNGLWIGLVRDVPPEFKRFDIRDGLGLVLLRGSGIAALWVSARPSPATRIRAAELGVDDLLQLDGRPKLDALGAVLSDRGIAWSEVAYVGDDLADLAVMQRAGLPLTVPDAVPEIQAVAAGVTRARGGQGAVREIIEALLRARGEWDAITARYSGARP